MKKLKFYINNENDLNEYEKENKRISYGTLIKYLFSDMILCNELPNYMAQNDDFIDDCAECGTNLIYLDEEGNYRTREEYENDETGEIYTEYKDIYQYFIVNMQGGFSYDFIKKYCKNEIILFYSEKLDLYILGVDHFGTGWNYVLTDFEYITEYENSMQDLLYSEV